MSSLRMLHGTLRNSCYNGVNVAKSNSLPNGNNSNPCASSSKAWRTRPGTQRAETVTRVKRAKDCRG